jgi:hypothetical protein
MKFFSVKSAFFFNLQILLKKIEKELQAQGVLEDLQIFYG